MACLCKNMQNCLDSFIYLGLIPIRWGYFAKIVYMHGIHGHSFHVIPTQSAIAPDDWKSTTPY